MAKRWLVRPLHDHFVLRLLPPPFGHQHDLVKWYMPALLQLGVAGTFRPLSVCMAHLASPGRFNCIDAYSVVVRKEEKWVHVHEGTVLELTPPTAGEGIDLDLGGLIDASAVVAYCVLFERDA